MGHLPVCRPRRAAGLTLIELVITIAVGSVVVAFMALFIVGPMNAYSAQSRRADLVDEADAALRLMARDLRAALPNSVRVATSGSVTALELLQTIDGARYQGNAPLANAALALDFTQPDGAFATTVPFTQLALPWSSSSAYLAIYNVGVPGANAYDMANVITPKGTTITVSAGATANQNLVTLSPAFQFAWNSPGRRVYLVAGPVTYLCDSAAGTLKRYSGYTIASSQPVAAATLAAAGASVGTVAADVGACQFSFASGTATRNALATLSLSLARSGEGVGLLHQVQLVNAP
ncbi:MAG: prepilin-type N-terminal cleavage/methylation domain-containing protein [Proteobacteria bacterium]|nr:prepilin-type N-terminal cleavage/methylation domain-containing protein [Pseudomonadota bacterium]